VRARVPEDRSMSESFVIPPAPRPAVPVVGSDRLFAVRRVYCIGRNYAAHTREMGGDPTREAPFFFQKASDTLQPVADGGAARHVYPPMTSNYHHEVEMLVALKSGGTDIPVESALNHVFGYAVGLDMTRRDLQDEAKQLRRPWEAGKSSDHSAPCGPLFPVGQVGHPAKGFIRVSVDGIVRQNGDLSDMIWSVAEQIAILSRYYTLEAGDVILSGTPDGVGKVERGQTMLAEIAGLGSITLNVV
jgi:fumarylpyruvate hydrolase